MPPARIRWGDVVRCLVFFHADGLDDLSEFLGFGLNEPGEIRRGHAAGPESATSEATVAFCTSLK